MGLKSYIAKRIVYSLLLVLFVITLNFIIFMLMPGDPTAAFMPPPGGGAPAGPEYEQWVQNLKDLWGLADPLHIRFTRTLQNLLTWNFGKTIIGSRNVAEMMAMRMPYTIWLIGSSTALSIIIGVLFGVLAAQKRGSPLDTYSVVMSLLFYSLPVFWMGMIFIYAFAVQLRWLPTGGAFPPDWTIETFPRPFMLTSDSSISSLNIQFAFNSGDMLRLVGGFVRHAVLPVSTLVLFNYAGYLLLTRATMLETLTEDYVVTAKAKGLPEREILFKHALKNASLPLITNVALAFGFILSGAILTETIYNYPGLGRWIWEAISARDYPILMPTFYVIALCVIVANFLSDLLYGVVDPRIKQG